MPAQFHSTGGCKVCQSVARSNAWPTPTSTSSRNAWPANCTDKGRPASDRDKIERGQLYLVRRDIEIDDEGSVFTSNSNFPAWQIEDGKPTLIRIRETR